MDREQRDQTRALVRQAEALEKLAVSAAQLSRTMARAEKVAYDFVRNMKAMKKTDDTPPESQIFTDSLLSAVNDITQAIIADENPSFEIGDKVKITQKDSYRENEWGTVAEIDDRILTINFNDEEMVNYQTSELEKFNETALTGSYTMGRKVQVLKKEADLFKNRYGQIGTINKTRMQHPNIFEVLFDDGLKRHFQRSELLLVETAPNVGDFHTTSKLAPYKGTGQSSIEAAAAEMFDGSTSAKLASDFLRVGVAAGAITNQQALDIEAAAKIQRDDEGELIPSPNEEWASPRLLTLEELAERRVLCTRMSMPNWVIGALVLVIDPREENHGRQGEVRSIGSEVIMIDFDFGLTSGYYEFYQLALISNRTPAERKALEHSKERVMLGEDPAESDAIQTFEFLERSTPKTDDRRMD